MSSNKSLILKFMIALQFTTLLIYLNANIVNVGDFGTALPLLVGFIGLSALLVVIFFLEGRVYFCFHFALFLLLMSWMAFRVIFDLSDLYYLKQITVATTGGMLLFYTIGALLGLTSYSVVSLRCDITIDKYIVLLFAVLSIWMLYSFSHRLSDSLFYLQDVNGNYQRPGNFLSISFIIVSFAYLNLVLSRIGQVTTALSGFFWLCIYSLSTLIVLICSQLFGSNSATAVVLGVYLITMVVSIISAKEKIWLSYLEHKLSLPWSWRLIKQMMFISLFSLMSFFGLLALVIWSTGFDINSLQVMGFGSGTNTSLLSRVQILTETGYDQLGYAPLFGNMNVAYFTTGNAARTLHSFFPYVMANLGLVGFSIVSILLVNVFVQLYRESKRSGLHSLDMYRVRIFAIYSMFMLLYILIFANLATDVSWIVLWFFIGFSMKPIRFKKRSCIQLTYLPKLRP